MNPNPQVLRYIGSLSTDPGYLLLLDQLQAELDTLTNDLANPDCSRDESLSRLQYWRAYRDIIGRLQTIPANYLQIHETEGDYNPDTFQKELWQKLQARSKSMIPFAEVPEDE